MKQKFISYYMDIAHITSKLSSAKRLQVGAVIVKDHKILATGYNGMPSGWDNICEHEVNNELVTKREVLHAEMNSLMKVTQSTESSAGSTMFCTHAPCMDCAKAIYQSGIVSIYYREKYRDDSGLKFLQLSGVNVQQY